MNYPREKDGLLVESQVGENVKRRRAELDITQAECARRSGLPVSEIAAIEAGEREPLSDTLLRLSAALEWQVSDLFAGVRWRTPREDGHKGHFEVDGRQR